MSRQIMVVLSNDNGFARLNRDINELIFKITMLDKDIKPQNLDFILISFNLKLKDKDNKLSPPKTLISSNLKLKLVKMIFLFVPQLRKYVFPPRRNQTTQFSFQTFIQVLDLQFKI